jgi:hypothetical protein
MHLPAPLVRRRASSLGLGLLVALLGAGCQATGGQPSCGGGPCCVALGGGCQSPDLPCAAGRGWAGYELCGVVDNDSCCLPVRAPGGATRCEQVGGGCVAPGAACPAGKVSAGMGNDLCPESGGARQPCCLPAP